MPLILAEEEKHARSLPPDELTRDAQAWKPFDSTDGMDLDSPSAKRGHDEIDKVEDDDEVEEERPKKKKKKTMKKKSAKVDSAGKKMAGEKKGEKKKEGAKNAEDEGLDNTQACPRPESDAKKAEKKREGEKDAEDQGFDNAQARPPCPRPKPLHDVGNHSGTVPTPFSLANIDPALLLESGILGHPDMDYRAPEDGPMEHQNMNGSYGSVAPITGPNDNPNPFVVPDEHPDAMLFHSSPVNEIGTSPTHSHHRSVPPSDNDIESPPSPCPDKGEIPPAHSSVAPEEDLPPDALLLQRESWKPWYAQIHKTFDALDLPGQWSMVTMYLTLLEGQNTFEKGTAEDSLTAEGQPKWLSHWVHCGRKAVPHKVMPDLTSIGEEWWMFWKGLQPVWHDIDRVKGPLSASHRGDIVGEKEWGELSKRGVNGVITAVAGLAFWGVVALGGTRRQKDMWDNAVEETKWVLQAMASPQ
ncbi:hypothetical protein EV421DRAFT_1906638 [Armillaria borealis]|uniref:Uncharacterized protein n=1 Tax=Armillaria borealis TaxID=47425 RepID=A0AA39MLS7_9AGAR|nr:hypothetical protein EV421DRAFT_1906638 [Armillaria borealis]